ncbi:MAG: hypothetical protein H0T18_04270 [Chloroflexia bacterium]|nr:hypothetical protein [Chloroflexia bacterium]
MSTAYVPAPPQPRHAHPVRGVQASVLLERFFVSGVAAVLLIRGWLGLTGYPQIGGDGLHVAHMLFGGIGMLIALLAGFAFIGSHVRGFAAIVGGAGFGAFIDELGKFITSDNNYFYQPAVAMIYVVFILIFIAGERLTTDSHPTPDERLAQALDVISGSVIDGYPKRERDLAMELLSQADPNNPLAPALRRALAQIAATPEPEEEFPGRLASRIASSYTWLVGQRWFLTLVLSIAVLATIFSLRSLSITILADPDDNRLQAYLDSTAGLLLVANLIFGALLIAGLIRLRHSLLAAFQWFRRAVLVSLLVAQPLAFYEQQWAALFGLAFNLVLLSALEFGITRETGPAGQSATTRS